MLSMLVYNVMKGSHGAHVTNYTWSFGDGSDRVFALGYNKSKTQQHIFRRTGVFTVHVTAANAMGSGETSFRVWIQGQCLLEPA